MRLVLLHALPFDGRMWDADLDLGPRTLAPTLYGLGASVEEWARSVLVQVGDEPIVVVGCSVGGSCALEVARAAPEQVVGVVLVGAKAGVRPDPVARDEAVRILTERGVAGGWTEYWRPLFGPDVSATTIEAAQRLALEQRETDIVRGVRAFYDRGDLAEFVQTWAGPIFVISGDRDRTPTPSAAALAGSGPNRRFEVVERCGHYVNLERPAAFRQLVSDAMDWFVARP